MEGYIGTLHCVTSFNLLLMIYTFSHITFPSPKGVLLIRVWCNLSNWFEQLSYGVLIMYGLAVAPQCRLGIRPGYIAKNPLRVYLD